MANKPARPDLVPATPAPNPAHVTRPPTPRAPGAAGKSESRATGVLQPPSTAAPRRQLAARAPRFAAKPASQAGSGVVGGRLESPEPAGAAKPPEAAPTPPPPAASVTQTVTVVAAAPAIVTAPGGPADQNLESKAISSLSIAGRDAAELMKVMPGMAGTFGLRYTLLRRGEGDQDVEVPPDTGFRRHESVHLRIEAAQGGYLYVLAGKRPLFAGAVVANQPVLIATRPGVLQAVLLPQPDSGPLSTLVSRARQQQLEAARFQRPAPILLDISIKSR
jgi:hypothetical protein